ncbi:MAG: hypothetical protein M1836_006113 [Candelina mexicana]|nr:MAG: hypothetical protein M1836_006113 [Candelina mexicana]
MVAAVVLTMQTFCISLSLSLSFASPLVIRLAPIQTSANPALLFRRTIPSLEAVDLTHPASAVGLTTSEPTCSIGTHGVPTVWSDCVNAYDQMEEEEGGRVTGYVGNSANLAMFESMESAAMDYLGIPRAYWSGSCIIDISAQHNRRGEYGMIVESDIAHKNAIKTTAAGILNHCVRRAQGGGWDTAGAYPSSLSRPFAISLTHPSLSPGQYLHLRISVIALEKLSGQARDAIILARRQGHTSAIIHFAFNNPPPNVITSTPPGNQPASFDPGMILPPIKMPLTACLRDGDTKCGYGIECKVEGNGGTGGEGLRKVLWGAVVEVGSCAWAEGVGSGYLS